MASMLMKNPVTSSTDRSILARRKKKKRSLTSTNQTTIINQNNNNNNNNRDSITEWKSQAQQQVYSFKLLKELRQVQITSTPAPKGGRAVREVADRVLAIAAKGRSRWSRAILTNRLKLKFVKRLPKRQRVAASVTSRLPKKPKPRVNMMKPRMKYLPAFQKKARVLSHIVPGCRKQPLPVVLEEATDYIAALEMQIRAMSALADLLSGTSASNAPLDQLGSSQPPPNLMLNMYSHFFG